MKVEKHSEDVYTIVCNESDTRLIAAAPELLALLGEAVEELQYGNPHDIATDTYRYDNKLIHAALAAIAKATGAA